MIGIYDTHQAFTYIISMKKNSHNGLFRIGSRMIEESNMCCKRGVRAWSDGTVSQRDGVTVVGPIETGNLDSLQHGDHPRHSA